MSNMNTSQDLDGDLDFKIEIGGDEEAGVQSIGSNDNKIKNQPSGSA